MRYPIFFADAGVPKAALSPTVTWRVLSDASSPGTPPAVSELDASNAPGWYYFEATPTEPIVVTVDGTATLADADRYKSLVISPQDAPDRHKRIVYTAWDARGNPTAGKVLHYPSAAALDADEDPWAGATQELDLVATYDGANRPTTFEQG